MKNRMLIFILLFIGAIKISSQTYTEMLGRPTDKTITVNVLFDSEVVAYFEYGTVKGNYTNTTSTFTSVINEPIKTIIAGLQPETRYYYRTRYHKTGATTFLAGTEHTFITQRKKGSKFVFTVESDPHPYDPKGYHPLWDIALQNQLNDGADFMLDLGDTFGDDHLDKVTNLTRTSAQVQQLMLDNREHFGKVCHSMPLLFCLGNHEGEFGYYLLQTPPNNLATYETLWRKMYYPNPFPDGFYTGNNEVENFGMDKPENYYAFEWGDALFVVVDGWRYSTANIKPRNWEWTIGKTQYDWLKQTLETSKAKYKFVFTHHVMGETRGGVGVATGFEWGGMDGASNKFAANRPGWELPIHQLMVKNKVNVLFQGHDHLFARESLDSLVYQTIPIPCDSSYSLGYIANASAFTGKILAGSGHIRVTVDADSAKVDYVCSRLPKDETPNLKNGDIYYSYTLKTKTVSGINDVSLNSNKTDWNIFPNPATDFFNLSFNQPIDAPYDIRISSIDGRLINHFYNLTNDAKTIKLIDNKGSKLNSGLYIVSLLQNNLPISNKLLMMK